jgi:hypothetical protein
MASPIAMSLALLEQRLLDAAVQVAITSPIAMSLAQQHNLLAQRPPDVAMALPTRACQEGLRSMIERFAQAHRDEVIRRSGSASGCGDDELPASIDPRDHEIRKGNEPPIPSFIGEESPGVVPVAGGGLRQPTTGPTCRSGSGEYDPKTFQAPGQGYEGKRPHERGKEAPGRVWPEIREKIDEHQDRGEGSRTATICQ